MSAHDTQIARAMFLTEPLFERQRDVRGTEALARDIQDYDPGENDWPGVDTKGADPQATDWEEADAKSTANDSGDVRPSINYSSRARGVQDYVNWFGYDSRGQEVWAKSVTSTLEPSRTWVENKWKDGDWDVVTLRTGSKLYRSEYTENFDSPVTGHWFTRRKHALMYNNLSYAPNYDMRDKQTFPAIVSPRSIDLVDMNSRENVQMLTELARVTRSDAHRAITEVFPIDYMQSVGRWSEVGLDDIFCDWFRAYMSKFDGWIYIARGGGHHDEIYINEPAEVLTRGMYIVREVDYVKWQRTGDDEDD